MAERTSYAGTGGPLGGADPRRIGRSPPRRRRPQFGRLAFELDPRSDTVAPRPPGGPWCAAGRRVVAASRCDRGVQALVGPGSPLGRPGFRPTSPHAALWRVSSGCGLATLGPVSCSWWVWNSLGLRSSTVAPYSLLGSRGGGIVPRGYLTFSSSALRLGSWLASMRFASNRVRTPPTGRGSLSTSSITVQSLSEFWMSQPRSDSHRVPAHAV